jgi:DNA-binding beta-propeller fold protein YncE
MRVGSLWPVAFGAILAASCFATTGPETPAHPLGEHADSVFLGLRPYGVAVTQSDIALVTQLDGARVSRARLIPPALTGAVAVGDVPTGIAIDPAGTTALVTNQHDFTVGIVDVASGTQVKTLSAASNTFRAIINSTGNKAYVTQASGVILGIDMQTRTIIGTVASVAMANGIALSGDTLLIVTSVAGQIAYIDTRTLTETKRIASSGTLQDVVLSPGGNEFYVAIESGPAIEVRSVATGALTGAIFVGVGTFGLAMTPDGSQLWATSPGSGLVKAIDLSTRQVVGTMPAFMPRRVAFNRLGTVAVVSDESGWVYFIQ